MQRTYILRFDQIRYPRSMAYHDTQESNHINLLNIFRTYAGTIYIAYCKNEIVNTIISFFWTGITFNIS